MLQVYRIQLNNRGYYIEEQIFPNLYQNLEGNLSKWYIRYFIWVFIYLFGALGNGLYFYQYGLQNACLVTGLISSVTPFIAWAVTNNTLGNYKQFKGNRIYFEEYEECREYLGTIVESKGITIAKFKVNNKGIILIR